MNKATVPVPVTSSSSDPRWRSRVRQAKSTAGSGGGSRTGFRGGGTTAAAAAAATASMYTPHWSQHAISSFCRAEKPKPRTSATLPTICYIMRINNQVLRVHQSTLRFMRMCPESRIFLHIQLYNVYLIIDNSKAL